MMTAITPKNCIAFCLFFCLIQNVSAQQKASRVIPIKSLQINSQSKSTLATSSAAVSNNFYVNDNYNPVTDHYTTAAGSDANPGTSSAPFATIQHAIDVASNGDIIFVDAGTYREDITSTTQLTIKGSNYGIDPNTGSRIAESILQPATSNPDPNSGNAIFYLDNLASGSVIDGFTIDGDNPTIGSGIDAVDAIGAYGGLSNTSITNNIISNVSYTGVDYYNAGNTTAGNTVSNNKFNNILQSSGADGIFFYNCYTQVTNNYMTNVGVGVQTENFYTADPGNDHSISNNTISSTRKGIWHNNIYQNATTFVINNNSITTDAGATANEGLEISSIQSAVGVSINNNNVTGAKYGIDLWNCTTSNTVSINGGTLTNCGTGVFPNNWDGYPDPNNQAGNSIYIISGVSIQNASVAGIYVKDNVSNTWGTSVVLQITGNTLINNSSIGLKIEGHDASATFTGASPANFTGQSVYITMVSNTADVPSANIDATNVKFEGVAGSAMSLSQLFSVEDKINHKIDWSSLGFVLVKANNDFVTVNSFYTPNTTFADIQRGVDAASNSWTLNVAAGTFSNSVNVTKSLTIKGAKSGILGKGRSGSESIVDPNSSTAHGFNITTDNVTIDGFTITNSSAYPSSSNERYGVVTISKTGSGNFKGISVKNNIISREFKAIDFNYTDNFEISNNWLHGESDSYNYGCMWIDDYGKSSTTGLIKNNDLDGYNSTVEIQGDATHLVSLLTITENRSTYGQYVFFGMANSTVFRNSVLNVTTGSHVYIGGGNTNDLFSENFFDNGSFNGIRVADQFGAGINSKLTITNNSITGHTNAGYYEINVDASAYSGTLPATCNWFGSNITSVIATKINGPVSYIPYLKSGTDNDPATPGFQPTPNSCSGGAWYVNDSYVAGQDRFTTAAGNDVTGDGSSSKPYRKINKAISSAGSGDIIYVDAGSYPEYINVPKSLTFYGTNYDKSISYQNPASCSCRNTESVITAQPDDGGVAGAGGPSAFEVHTLGLSVTVQGFKIQGGKPLTDGHYHRPTDNSNNVNILFYRNFVTSADNLFCGSYTTWRNVTIKDNYFSLINKNTNSSAIQLNDANDGTTAPVHAANVTAVIDSNSINNTNFAGILLDNISNAEVKYNSIMNTPGEAGIQLAGGMGNAEVMYNNITKANVTSISPSIIPYSADGGAIRIYGSAFTGTINIGHNLIVGSYNGFAVKDGENITNLNIHINKNSLYSGTGYGFGVYHGTGTEGGNGGSSSAQGGSIDAECNYFGSGNAGVIATRINNISKVDYTPFLAVGTNTTTYTVGATGGPLGYNAATACGSSIPVAPPALYATDNVVTNVIKGFTVKVSPNPSTNDFIVRIQSEFTEPVKINVIDFSGKLITSFNSVSSESTITFGNNFKAGVYFAQIIQGQNHLTLRLVKIK